MPRSTSFLPLPVILAAIATLPAVAEQPPRPAEEILGVPQPVPYIVCPPKYPESTYAPADLLLFQADVIQPVTAEGWIVTNRSVPACCNGIPDAATRAYQDFEYPLRVRQYDSLLRLAEVELEHWQQRIPVYRYFNKTGALLVDYQNAVLARLAAEERLRNLRYERMLFIRHHNREARLSEQGVIVSQEFTQP